MTGTPSQVEWADLIKVRVADEFDRVAKAFQTAADKQSEQDQTDTLAVIAILEEKRTEVLAHDRAGYFIRDWQELSGRVRQTIAQDSRYQAIKAGREARSRRTQ
jgi:cell division FtsZ-interacting protein ZapD